MSGPPIRSAHLLHADEDQLDRAAIALRSGTAFVVAVCPVELRKVAQGRLQGQAKGLSLPEPVEVGSPEEMMAALIEQVDRRDRVLSLVLGRDVDGALDGLNLHREKVVKGGPVILWLEDVAALRKMRERAPDAFSFRSTMVVVRGDGGPVPAPKGEEPEVVTELRRRLKRTHAPLDRAAAALNLAEQLRVRGHHAEAGSLARRALGDLPILANNDDERDVRAAVCFTLAQLARTDGNTTEAIFWNRRALSESEPMSMTRGIARRATYMARSPGPRGIDRSMAEGALNLVRDYGLAPEVREQALRCMGAVAIDMGDCMRARKLLEESRSCARHVDVLSRASTIIDMGDLERVCGHLDAAENYYREGAAMIAAAGGGSSAAPIWGLGGCSIDAGELDVAVRLIGEARASLAGETPERESLLLAGVAFARNDIEAAIARVAQALRAAEARTSDGSILTLCENLVAMLDAAQAAGNLTSELLGAGQRDLELAADLVLDISGPEGPPWYPCQLLALRAQLLVLTADTLPQALDLLRQAVDRARDVCPDLLPVLARSLADHLFAAKPEEALALIADVEPYASQNGFLEEHARLLANRVLALVQRGDAASAIAPHLAALREALTATGSPRIAAETLRDLAIRLPPTASMPDPLALAEEAHPLFVAMPMPAEDARCLELMGDVLLARGRPDEAKRRFLNARARLTRYGLGLRVPLLDKKISAIA
jgi:tetratricopeptide (TPR) repeat protein